MRPGFLRASPISCRLGRLRSRNGISCMPLPPLLSSLAAALGLLFWRIPVCCFIALLLTRPDFYSWSSTHSNLNSQSLAARATTGSTWTVSKEDRASAFPLRSLTVLAAWPWLALSPSLVEVAGLELNGLDINPKKKYPPQISYKLKKSSLERDWETRLSRLYQLVLIP